ncbi:hypothetical protein ACTD5D_20875 [Nocardia takedensis]|uniref:hypothetical protein n=1 Tax=Nocardia takedensis TaxID=259390 RepID=UPI003F774FA0
MSPLLAKAVLEPVTINSWWFDQPVFVHGNAPYSRKRIIQSMVNKDGGAHVDAHLERFYVALQTGMKFIGFEGSFTFDGPTPYPQGQTIYPNNGHYCLLRQFAHEVLETAAREGWA